MYHAHTLAAGEARHSCDPKVHSCIFYRFDKPFAGFSKRIFTGTDSLSEIIVGC